MGSRISQKFDDGVWYNGTVTGVYTTDPSGKIDLVDVTFDDEEVVSLTWPDEDRKIIPKSRKGKKGGKGTGAKPNQPPIPPLLGLPIHGGKLQERLPYPDDGVRKVGEDLEDESPLQSTAVFALEDSTEAGRSFNPRGMENHGNTCFLNATVQALQDVFIAWNLDGDAENQPPMRC